MKKLTIETMQKIAENRNGKCLSTEYINSETPLEWQCECGNVWMAKPNNIRNGNNWCPKCAIRKNNSKKTRSVLDMQNLVKKHHGRCLSKKYLGPHKKLKWECRKNHLFSATPASVQQNHWCPYCAGNVPLDIKQMKRIAESKGGQCLSSKYINAHEQLKWQCKHNHIFSTTYANVSRNKWCPHCAGNAPLNLDDMKKIAKARGGKCLSNKYINIDSKLLWQCKFGHKWKASGSDVKSGKWCKTCSAGLGERICRVYFEQIFGGKFPNTRPAWLINPETGNRLELDGYNKDLKLAFEHQGAYHYKVDGKVNKDIVHLKKRQKIDRLKRDICKINNIVLIEIPELFTLTKLDELKSLIIRTAHEKTGKLPQITSDIKINLKGAYTNDMLKYYSNIARKRKGKLLSKVYKGSSEKLEWQCEKGHKWPATPNNIQRGKWCNQCVKNKKLSIEHMQALAKAKGGICLSKIYKNSHTHLRWQCSKGHIWEASPSSVRNSKSWCPICYNDKRKSASVKV